MHILFWLTKACCTYNVKSNALLNRRGEFMVCRRGDVLNMFYGSDLECLVTKDILVTDK